MTTRVLVVEDEVKLAELIRDYLVHAGFEAATVHRGDEVEAALALAPAELVILDLQLPGVDGLELCRRLRARGPLPAILMLTARVEEIDRLLGLELGADDYVCKPFSMRELMARTRAILRRGLALAPDPQRVCIGQLELDPAGRRALVAGVAVKLTPIEAALLAALVEQPRRIWSRERLLDRARRDEPDAGERIIDVHIKNLRRKLKPHFPHASPIRSVYGAGYGLDVAVLYGPRGG